MTEKLQKQNENQKYTQKHFKILLTKIILVWSKVFKVKRLIKNK